MEPLSNELILEIFSFSHLTSIILCRGVCRRWGDLVLEADIHPIRRQLFRIYCELVKTKFFHVSRPRVLQTLQKFDRKAYLDALTRQSTVEHPAAIPIAFEMYILEWPERAAFDCMWPGLPYEWSDEDRDIRRVGWNLLANIPPQLFELPIISRECPEPPYGWFVAALPIWENDGASPSVWLVMDPTHGLHGFALRATDFEPTYEVPDVSDESFDQSLGGPWTNEERDHCKQLILSRQLPFLDWLDVSMQRLELQTEETIEADAFFDELRQRWVPVDRSVWTYGFFPDKGQTGGDLQRLKPTTEPVAPLPVGRAMSVADMRWVGGTELRGDGWQYVRERERVAEEARLLGEQQQQERLDATE